VKYCEANAAVQRRRDVMANGVELGLWLRAWIVIDALVT
jgi:hypothetical protein